MNEKTKKTNYINNLTKRINTLMTPAVTASYVKIEKNNDIILPGIKFETINLEFAPVIYIDKLLNENIDVDNAADMIIDQFYKANPNPIAPEMITLLTDYSFIKDNVYPMLTKNPNTEWFTMSFLDMCIAFYIRLNEYGTVMVTKKLLDIVKMESKELKLSAIINESYHTKFRSMFETIIEITPEMADFIPEDDTMYVLTNDKGFRGASQICDRLLLERIADKLNDSFYIIPSSIHEVIIISYSKIPNKDEVKSMIGSINSDESIMNPIDVLSNNLYLYIKDDPWLKIIS